MLLELLSKLVKRGCTIRASKRVAERRLFVVDHSQETLINDLGASDPATNRQQPNNHTIYHSPADCIICRQWCY
jgi:hypothetical protein